MTPHRQTRRNIIRLLAGQPADEIFQAVLDVKFARVEDVGRDLCGRGDETYPEAALLLDIDDDVSNPTASRKAVDSRAGSSTQSTNL